MGKEVDALKIKILKLRDDKIEDILKPKKINKFSNSGAYIPVTGDYDNFFAYVIVLKRGIKE